MKKPTIAIKLRSTDYSELAALGSRIYESMLLNPYFPAPSPSLPVLQSAVNSVMISIALRGDAHNHGTTHDLIELRRQSGGLHRLLKAMASYVENTALLSGNDYGEMARIISSSGFSLKSEGSPQGLLEPVRDLRRFISRSLNANQVKIVWEEPLNVTSENNVKSCLVFKGESPVFSEAQIISAATRKEFVDTNDTGAPVTWYYWVMPVGAAGKGALSNMLIVNLLPI